MKNEMEIIFDGISNNESLARLAVAAFVTHLNPTLEELADIKTAVSEAVTNAIIHGYGNTQGYTRHGEVRPVNGTVGDCKVKLHCVLKDGILFVDVEDEGIGIADIEKAMEPLFTTRPELERSGMGFAFMEAFMDDLQVESTPGKGTKVHMQKKLCCGPWLKDEE